MVPHLRGRINEVAKIMDHIEVKNRFSHHVPLNGRTAERHKGGKNELFR